VVGYAMIIMSNQLLSLAKYPYSPMPDFITLTCPTCGGKLKVTDQIHLLACAHCGNEHFVHRDGGAIYLAPLAQDVRHIRVGVDKTAAELAVARLTKEVADLDAAMEVTTAWTIDQWIPESSGENAARVLAIVAILLAAVSMMAGGQAMGVFMLVTFIFCVSVFMYLKAQRTKAAEMVRDNETARIKNSLLTKTTQLAKNRRIAES
jgi:hypothetical protein